MAEVPASHTLFSWAGGAGRAPRGHTRWSWTACREALAGRHEAGIGAMDAAHVELYLTAGSREVFAAESAALEARGRSLDNWVCPWQATEAGDVLGLVHFMGLTSQDVLVDVGCGDGRVLVGAAAVAGCRGVGIDVAEECVTCARDIARKEGVAGRVEAHVADFCTPASLPPLEDATVVYVYLVHRALRLARPLLERLSRAGKRICTHEYHFDE